MSILPRIATMFFGLLMLALTGAFYALPAWHLVLWSSLALSSAAAIAVGVLMHRPARPLPWWLLALAVTVFAAGDTTYNVLTTILGRERPFPSLADVFYLAMYPLAAAGLVLLIRRRTGGRDRGSLLDALGVTTATALLSWIFFIDPYVQDVTLTWQERATSITYPLGDILLMATLARLLITSGSNRAAALLGAGVAGLLASDIAYGLGQLDRTWAIGSCYDLGWVVFYITWGLAALHPSMADLTVPARAPSAEMGIGRIALLMAVSLVAPGALLAESLTGEVRSATMIAASSALLFLIVLVRLAGVVARHRQAVERERTLRTAGADLVSAGDATDLATSVRRAVDRLVPPGATHRAVLLVDGATAGVPGPGADIPEEPSRLLQVADLDGVAARETDGFTTALVCPLVPTERPTAGSSIGLLVVAAAEPVLCTLRGALEVLASQTALAVERVTLSQEVTRRNNEAYFRTLVQNAHDVILIVDDGGHIRYASPSAEAVLGPGSLLARPVVDLVTPADRDAAERALPAGDGGSGTSYRLLRTDGARIDVEVTSRDLRDDPTVRGFVLTLRDVTDQRKLEQELTHRASHDSLTGLANRVLFRDRIERALAARPHGIVGVLLVDLDDFKLVNDTMGHGIGDELLVAVAGRLIATLRPDDLAARLGGDEFAILIEGATGVDEIEEIAARIVDALGAPLDIGSGLATSVSVGVATTPDASGSAEMLSQADLALYAAKGAGKGRWRRYEPSLHLAAVDRLEVRTELERAIALGAFTLLYQPIVDLRSGVILGVEALVRWRHPRRGTVAPGDFIHVAEETGLVVPLGSWVLDCALADLARWRRESAPGTSVMMSVNVSALQVRAPGFLEALVAALAQWDVPAESLILEITETALLADDDRASADLAALRELGLHIAIDDFGTGYSSLDYLRQHAIDVLKIDRSFIDGIESSDRQAALVGAIVHLAQALDLRVVAEGVETPTQRDTLIEAGCRLAQGHLFSVPVPAEEIVPWLLAAAPPTGTGRRRRRPAMAAGAVSPTADRVHRWLPLPAPCPTTAAREIDDDCPPT
ncbi:MAG: EAL domain-containing protein [Pseudonocardia sp.]|nr:EAL domain-containing protein [Pseudonocardia sp.]